VELLAHARTLAALTGEEHGEAAGGSIRCDRAAGGTPAARKRAELSSRSRGAARLRDRKREALLEVCAKRRERERDVLEVGLRVRFEVRSEQLRLRGERVRARRRQEERYDRERRRGS